MKLYFFNEDIVHVTFVSVIEILVICGSS